METWKNPLKKCNSEHKDHDVDFVFVQSEIWDWQQVRKLVLSAYVQKFRLKIIVGAYVEVGWSTLTLKRIQSEVDVKFLK